MLLSCWFALIAPAHAADDSSAETHLRAGMALGGAYAGELTYRRPGALWVRALGGASAHKLTDYPQAIEDLGVDPEEAAEVPGWLDSGASLEAFWEAPAIGPLVLRAGALAGGTHTAAAEAWKTVDVSLDNDTVAGAGAGAEVAVPLQFGELLVTPVARAGYMVPLYVRHPDAETAARFADEGWEPLDFAGPMQTVGGRVEVAMGMLSARVDVDASLRQRGAYYESLDWAPPTWNYGATALVGVRFGGGKAEATAETKGAAADAAEAAPKLEIVDTGIASIDDVFRPARNILERVEEARNAVRDLRVGVQQAAGLAEGATLQEALTSIAVEFAKGVTVSMDGLRPVFKVKPQAPKQVQDVVKAIDTGVPRLLAAVEELGTVPARVEKLVAAAQALPAKLPADAKAAGISPLQVPALLKKLKGNLKAVAALPQLAGSALTEVKDTLAALAALAP